MINRVILMGRLCADPEFRQTTNGVAVCRFRIAINRPYKKDAEQAADFINCTAWRNTAEFVSRYFSKGKMIIVEGSLRNNNYTDNDGVKHYSLDVLADQVQFGESKSNTSQDTQTSVPHFDVIPQATPQNAAESLSMQNTGIPETLGEFEEILSDGEVPL